MAAYLASPPLATPPHAFGIHLVVSGHGSVRGVGLVMGSVGVNVPASPPTMGGPGVPGGTSNPIAELPGHRPDPADGVSAPGHLHPDSGVPTSVGGVGVRMGVSSMNMRGIGIPFTTGLSWSGMGGTGVPGGASVSLAGSGQGGPNPRLLLSCLGLFSRLGFPSFPSRPSRPLLCDGFCLSSHPSQRLPPILGFFSGYSGDHLVVHFSVGSYQEGRSSSSSSGPLGGARGRSSLLVYSFPSALCYWGSKSSIGDESDWAESTSDDILLSPIPLPADKVTLSPIKSGEDYLKSQDLILYWLRPPGFSTACNDSLLVTDTRNSLASQFWEGQLHMALKDGSVRHLFENTDSKYFGKGFEMLQVLEDNFRPSSTSNSFTTLLTLFNDTQGDKVSIHEFRSRFEGHLGALSCSSVAIPSILRVMLFLCVMHPRYGNLLTQFAAKQKDLSLASIDSVVLDAKFMDEFTAVGAGVKPKPGTPSPSPRSPATSTVVTNGEGKRYPTPFEWLALYNQGSLSTRWHKSLGGNFYCAFCNRKEKHHPVKCLLLGELGLKLIDISGGNCGSSLGSTPSAGAKGGAPPATPPAAAPPHKCH